MAEKPQVKVVPDSTKTDAPQSIAKPEGFDLNKFKSTRAAAMANVERLETALPIHTIAQAKDFVRLHPHEDDYWKDALPFVNDPAKGQNRATLHLNDDGLTMRMLPSAEITLGR